MVAYHTDATKLAVEAYAAGLRAAAEVCIATSLGCNPRCHEMIRKRIVELAAHPGQRGEGK